MSNQIAKYTIGLDDIAMDLVIKGLGKLPSEESGALYQSFINYRIKAQANVQPAEQETEQPKNSERI